MPRRSAAVPQQRPASPTEDASSLTSGQVLALLAETQALSARLAALHEVAAAMQSSLDTATVLSTLAREARWVLDFQYCSVAEVQEAGYTEHVLLPSPATRGARLLADGGPISEAIRSEHALLISQLDAFTNVPGDMASALIVPLRSRGTVIGTLNFFARQAKQYRGDDLRIAGALAAQAAVVIQNTRLFAAVTRARDELHTVLDTISDSVIVVRDDFTLLLVNRAARQLLGLGQVPLVGRSPTALLQGARGQGQRLLSRTQLAEFRVQARTAIEGSIRLRDGRSLEWRRSALHVGDALGQMFTLRDVTAQVQLDELRSDLMAMLVHDLRSPLTTMLLSLDLQESERIEERDQRELRERMRVSARQMLRHIDTLLDLRKLEAGRMELVREPTLLDSCVVTVLATYQVQAHFDQIALRSAIASNVPPISVDSPLIGRVLENLIGNALKFTGSGGTITVRVEYDERTVTVSVEDTGYGVPTHMRASIFEKYTQAEGGQKRKGTGLGLAFCNLVIEAHDGQIGLRDNPGGGSIFWFRLPLLH